MIPRWAHRAYAWLMGYFWLRCPNCCEMFGGHECGGYSFTWMGDRRVVCRRCSEQADRYPNIYSDFDRLS